jgi:tryptophanyl-tRNA synthetase
MQGMSEPRPPRPQDRPRVLSGIRPTGVGKHLGNYLGAVRQWTAMQDEYACFFFVADLHALTTTEGGAALRKNTHATVAELLALGVDPERSTVFAQSHLPEHTELAWVFNCLTGFGEAARMTQFKEKSGLDVTDSAEGEQVGAAEALRRFRGAGRGSSVSVGLFTYPVLQAADILLYQPQRVPVGEDQRQHLELTRDLAQRFNSRYGATFTVPEPYTATAAQRIKDLQDPSVKMSTSRGGPGTLWIVDEPRTITKKVKSAVTDTGREVLARADKPGITNLLTILSVATGRDVPELEAAYEGKGYGDFKGDVAEAVVEMLAPVRERYDELLANPGHLDAVLARGAARAREVALPTMAAVRERIGLLAPAP